MSFFLHAESFSRYGSGVITGSILTQMLYRYTSVGGGSIDTAYGRNGQGIQLSNSPLSRTVPHSSTWVVGIAMRAPSGSSNNVTIYQILNNDHLLFLLRYNVDRTLSIFANNTLIATTNRPLLDNRYYWLDFTVDLSGSTPITCTAELRINGNIEASGAKSTDWNASDLISGDTTANRHILDGFTNFQVAQYDDWYFKNASGYYGDIRIIALYPNGEGDTLLWTPSTGSVHYVLVNSHPVDITKYVKTATPGNIDTYNWEDIPTFSGTVKAVNMGFLANKDDEGSKSFKIVYGNTGTEELSQEFFVSSDTPEYYEHSNELDPATGLPWTQAGWNAKQAGIKLIS